MSRRPNLVDEALDRYLERMPNAREAFQSDPVYGNQTRWLHRVLALADLVLEDEGVAEQVRRRAVSAMLYGSLDEAEALRRHDDHQQRIQDLMRQPPAPVRLETWASPVSPTCDTER